MNHRQRGRNKRRRNKKQSANNPTEDEEQHDEPQSGALPIALVLQILTRTTIKTVIECKRVCKEWYKLISDPYFTNQYQKLSPFTTAGLMYHQRTSETLLPINALSYRFGVTEFGEDHNGFIGPIKLKDPEPDPMCVVSSCNGLLCLRRLRNRKKIYICNPLQREYIVLPKISLPSKYGYYYYVGFGFCSQTVKYKVVLGFEDTFCQLMILTVGVDSKWRILEDSSAALLLRECDCGNLTVPLNGKLHRIQTKMEMIEMDLSLSIVGIAAFDLGEEKLELISPPASNMKKISGANLGGAHLGFGCQINGAHLSVFGGCLGLVHYSRTHLDIWYMRDYGVKESWTKISVLASSNPYLGNHPHFSDYLIPIEIYRDGEMLLRSGKRCFTYDMKKKNLVEIKDYEIEAAHEDISYTPNFSSLNNIFEGGGFRILSF